MFAAIGVHHVSSGQEPQGLDLLAQEYSPRIETSGPSLVVFDASGLERLFGGARALATQVEQSVAARGWTCGVAVAHTRTAAVLLARARVGVTIVLAGREAACLAPLPVALLAETDIVLSAVTSVGAVTRPDVETAADEPGPTRGNAATRPDGQGGDARSRGNGARHARGAHGHYRLAPAPTMKLGEADAFRSQQESAEELEAASLKPQAVEFLSAQVQEALDVLTRWGVRTLGALAMLPPEGLRARLGGLGVMWQRLARGEDVRPLVRDAAEERFEQHLELEWPIEGLEPLSFVLARLLDPLCQHLERRDRGAVGVRLWLKLVNRTVFTRYLPLPVPMHDPKVLRTLLALDLESHPPPAGIDAVTVACDVAPGRIVQHSLLTRPLPTPDRVSTLMARLTALMGQGRCGAPVVPDTHRPGKFEMRTFAPEEERRPNAARAPDMADRPVRVADAGEAYRLQGQPSAMLRRFRRPVAAQVALRDERPVRVSAAAAGIREGHVRQCAGPWRTSGHWWVPDGVARGQGAWDVDEWDVALADRVVYRICRQRATGTWMVEGYWD